MYPVFQRNTYHIIYQKVTHMKLSKITLLLIGTVTLAACSFTYERHESQTHSAFSTQYVSKDPISSSDTSSNQAASSSIVSSSSEQSIAISSSSTTTSSSQQISSSIISSSSAVSSSSNPISSSSTATSSSSIPVLDKELIISFYNPSCGSISKEVLDERLTNYMNEIAATTFVTSVKNTNCQISNDIPTKDEKVLIIGAREAQGSLEFTFSETIKTITITAQTYHKPYEQTWTNPPVTIANVDTNSVLYINNHEVDLKPIDDQPVEKEYTEAINSKSFTLTNGIEDNSRVFIKSIAFVY